VNTWIIWGFQWSQFGKLGESDVFKCQPGDDAHQNQDASKNKSIADYVVVGEFTTKEDMNIVISASFARVGELDDGAFFDLDKIVEKLTTSVSFNNTIHGSIK
jgi:hypothetical protein